jgi:hypothetical protein
MKLSEPDLVVKLGSLTITEVQQVLMIVEHSLYNSGA